MAIDETLKKKLDHYLEHRKTIPGAFFVNGPWGSGKTTAVRYYFAEREDCLFISLNGVSSQEEIDRLIFAQLYPAWSKIENSHIARIGSALVSLILSNERLVKANGVKKLIDEVEGGLTREGDFLILVFDDLERARMDLRTLFGYLGRYIEDNNQSVILIGSESELIRMHSEDFEFKSELIKSIKTTKPEEVAKQDLVLANPYFRIKEKFIFDELVLTENIDLALKVFCDPDAWDGINVPEELRPKIENEMRRHGDVINLRSVIFARAKLIDLLLINDISAALQNNESVFSSLACAVLDYSIRRKESLSKPKNDLAASLMEHGMNLPESIIDHLNFGILNIEQIAMDLRELCQMDISHKRSSALRKLMEVDWLWAEDEDELADLMEEVVRDFKNGDVYDVDWLRIAQSLWWFQDEYEIKRLLDEKGVLDAVQACIEKNYKGKPCLDYEDQYVLGADAPEIKYLKPIHETAKKHNGSVTKDNVAQMTLSPSRLTREQMNSISEQSLLNRQFLAAIGTQRLTQFIDGASSSDVQTFIRIIRRVYRVSNIADYYVADIPTAKSFATYVHTLLGDDSVGKIKQAKLRDLEAELRRVIKALGFTAAP